MADALQWLNLLLVPIVGLLLGIERRLSAIAATQAHHAGELAELRPLRERVAELAARQSFNHHHHAQEARP